MSSFPSIASAGRRLAAALLVTPVLGFAQSSPSWSTRLDSVARAAIAGAGTPGATIAVVVDGRVAYLQGYGLANVETGQPMTSQMLLRVGSVSKMFTGALLAELEERGALDMQRPIARYVPSLQGKRVGAVTTHQLMTHNAGWLDNAVAYGRMGEGALGEVMREVGDTLFFTEPGRTFSYSNPSISMAGYVAEAATGKRFGTLLDSLMLRPLGMPRSTFRPLEALTWPIAMGHDPAGNGTSTVVRPMPENTAQWPAGFLFTSAPELARFAIMLMNGGQIDGRQILSRGAVRRLATGYVPLPGRGVMDSLTYGYGLMVGSIRLNGRSEPVWTHGGSINGYNAELLMLPERKAAVMVLVNGAPQAIAPIMSAAWQGVIGAPWPQPATATVRAATAAEKSALVGRYAMAANVLELVDVDGQLMLRQNGQSVPVQMESSTAFTARLPNGATMRLSARLENGRATYVYAGSRALARQAP
jgi:CubicO group peptidase (beta-lactamase class C family)